MIPIAFIVAGLAVLWAIKHAACTADPPPIWRSDASDPGD